MEISYWVPEGNSALFKAVQGHLSGHPAHEVLLAAQHRLLQVAERSTMFFQGFQPSQVGLCVQEHIQFWFVLILKDFDQQLCVITLNPIGFTFNTGKVPYRIFVTGITGGACGEVFVMWRNFFT